MGEKFARHLARFPGVRMSKLPATSVALTCRQPAFDPQVLGSTTAARPVVFRSGAVAQSRPTVSGQVTWYQKANVVPVALKVWAMLESPFVGEVEPARAA